MTPRVDWRLPEGLTPSDVARWRDLAARSAEPNPFHEPELVLPAIAHLPHARVRLLVATDAAGDWLGELRRQRAALATELGGDLIFADRAGEAAAVEEFLALEAAGWKGREGGALSVARHAGFFRALCRHFAEHGRLQLYALSAAGRTVA